MAILDAIKNFIRRVVPTCKASELPHHPCHCCRWPASPGSGGEPRHLPRNSPGCRRRSCQSSLALADLLPAALSPQGSELPSQSCRAAPWRALGPRKYQRQKRGNRIGQAWQSSSSLWIRKLIGELTPFDWLVWLSIHLLYIWLVPISQLTPSQLEKHQRLQFCN